MNLICSELLRYDNVRCIISMCVLLKCPKIFYNAHIQFNNGEINNSTSVSFVLSFNGTDLFYEMLLFHVVYANAYSIIDTIQSDPRALSARARLIFLWYKSIFLFISFRFIRITNLFLFIRHLVLVKDGVCMFNLLWFFFVHVYTSK